MIISVIQRTYHELAHVKPSRRIALLAITDPRLPLWEGDGWGMFLAVACAGQAQAADGNTRTATPCTYGHVLVVRDFLEHAHRDPDIHELYVVAPSHGDTLRTLARYAAFRYQAMVTAPTRPFSERLYELLEDPWRAAAIQDVAALRAGRPTATPDGHPISHKGMSAERARLPTARGQ